jgi:very-long-chain (3R)-3-hydroxyacyl-CoA dehydratase
MNLKNLYLLAYNGAQLLGWCYVLGVFVFASTVGGLSGAALYGVIGCALTGFQLAMLLDVVHAAVGLVRSPLFTAAMQVASRVLVVLVLHRFELARSSRVGLALILAAWSPTEIIRYAFYCLKSLGRDDASLPAPLLWLRYSSFLVLYPTGITGELLILYTALPQIQRDPTWHPLAYILYAVFAIYPVGSVILFRHMLAQRHKTLNIRSKPKTN